MATTRGTRSPESTSGAGSAKRAAKTPAKKATKARATAERARKSTAKRASDVATAATTVARTTGAKEQASNAAQSAVTSAKEVADAIRPSAVARAALSGSKGKPAKPRPRRKEARPAPPPPGPELGHVVERQWPGAPLRRGLGVALLGFAGAGRFASGDSQVVPGPGAALPAEPIFDVALGALDVGLEAGERVSAAIGRHVNPLLARALSPAVGPANGLGEQGLRFLGSLTQPLAERGRRLRVDSEYEAAAAVAAVLPETIQLVMEQLDLTDLAIDHVDFQRVLEASAENVDLTGFAIDNIDLARVIEASLDEVDFTGLAISRLDFARAVTAAMDQVDVMSLARDQLDPAKVAAYLRENVDVTEAIRSAPGAVAGEAVKSVRGTVGRITGRR